jgi:hypothetical protein
MHKMRCLVNRKGDIWYGDSSIMGRGTQKWNGLYLCCWLVFWLQISVGKYDLRKQVRLLKQGRKQSENAYRIQEGLGS